jgi:hypothetical protein
LPFVDLDAVVWQRLPKMYAMTDLLTDLLTGELIEMRTDGLIDVYGLIFIFRG